MAQNLDVQNTQSTALSLVLIPMADELKAILQSTTKTLFQTAFKTLGTTKKAMPEPVYTLEATLESKDECSPF